MGPPSTFDGDDFEGDDDVGDYRSRSRSPIRPIRDDVRPFQNQPFTPPDDVRPFQPFTPPELLAGDMIPTTPPELFAPTTPPFPGPVTPPELLYGIIGAPSTPESQ